MASRIRILKLVGIYAAVFIVSFTLTGIITTAVSNAGSEDTSPLASSGAYASVISEQREGYILRAVAGEVGVYRMGEEQPMFIVEITPELLRASDRALLEQGIYAGTYEELLSFIEDFTS